MYFLCQTQSDNAAPAAPVPNLSEAAFAPSPMNQYQTNPAPFQPAQEPNMAMNAAVKSNIPDNTQVSFRQLVYIVGFSGVNR